MLDPANRLLLVRFEMPTWTGWAAPGGGLAPGESHVDAIRRELSEEVGLDEFELGPVIWHRTHIIPFLSGEWDGQLERYFLVRTPEFTPAPRFSDAELRAEWLGGWRWWAVPQIERSQDAFAPTALPALARRLVEDGPPAEPIEVGV